MKKIIYILVFTMLVMSPAYADKKGEEVMKKFFDLSSPSSSTSDITLIIIDSKNNKRVRTLHSYSRETKDISERYMEFLAPADVKGTKFLNSEKQGKNAEQRLFLPALGKVRRIASSDKGSSFMGTDLSYYDLEAQDYEDFNYTFMEDTTIKDVDVSVVEAVPSKTNTDSPYTKQIFYVRKDNNYTLQVDCYEKDLVTKSIYNLTTKVYSGVIMPERMAVINHKDNKKTLVQFKDIAVNVKIPNDVFSIQNLERN